MKRHISIFALLLSAFAAGFAVPAQAFNYYAFSTHACTISDYDEEVLGFSTWSDETKGYSYPNWSQHGLTDMAIASGLITAQESQKLRFVGWYTRTAGWTNAEWPKTDDCTDLITSEKSISAAQISGAGKIGSQSVVLAKYVPLDPIDLTLAVKEGVARIGYKTGSGVFAYVSKDTVIKADYGSTYDLIAEATGGWSFNGSSTKNETFANITSAKTFAPVPERVTYTVTVAPNGGSGGSCPSYTVSASQQTKTITLPTRTGYSIASSWGVSGAKDGKPTVSGNTLTIPAGTYGNLTLTPTWTANEYSLTVNPNSGSYEGQPIEQTLEEKLCYDATKLNAISVATRENYTLSGYYTSSSGGIKVYDGNGHNVKCDFWTGAYPSGTFKGTSDLKVYAIWTPNASTVTLDKQGGTGGAASVSVKYDTTVPSITSLPTRTGYAFEGYYTGKNGGGRKYYNANGEGIEKWISTGTTMLYANWTPNGYKVQYELCGGSTGTDAPSTAKVGTAFRVSMPMRAGYTFTGWNVTGTAANYSTAKWGIASDASSTAIQDASAVCFNSQYSFVYFLNLTMTQDATVTLKANWKAKTYTVTFDGNGGTPTPTSATVTYDSNYGNLATCTRKGYVFKGWWTAKEGGTQITETTTVELTAAQALYAHWEAKKYNVTIDPKGGLFNKSTKPTTFERALTFDSADMNSLDVPVREDGTKFLGYYTSGGVLVYNDKGECVRGETYWNADWPDGKYVNDGHLTVEARWSEASRYTIGVSSDSGKGTATGGGTFEAGTSVTLTATPNAGYSFAGWQREVTSIVSTDNPYKFTASSAAAGTYVAIFTGNVYKVTFRESRQSQAPFKYVTFGEAYGELPKYSTTTEEIEGWYTDYDGAGKRINETTPVTTPEDHNLYAKWTEKKKITVIYADQSRKNTWITNSVEKSHKITDDEARAITKGWSAERDYKYWIKGWNPTLPLTVEGDTTITAVWESYSDVLDCSDLEFDVRANWFVDTTSGFYTKGDSCLKLTNIGGDDFVSVKVTEPGTFTFNWKAGSKATALYVNEPGGGGKAQRYVVTSANQWTPVTIKATVASEEKPAEIKFKPSEQEFDDYLALDAVTWTPGLPPVISHTVEVTTDGPGAVSKSPVRGTYAEGETVTLTAAADTGYAFCSWVNETGVVANVNPWTFTVTGDVHCWATFTNCSPVDVGYTVTVTSGEHGTAGKSPDLTGYKEGSSVTLTAMPDPGYAFASWSDGSADASHDITVMSNASYTATFTASVYTVTFDANGGELKGTATKSVTYGEPYGTLPEATWAGKVFAGWMAARNGGETVTSASRVMSAKNHTLYAQWNEKDVGDISRALGCSNLRFVNETDGWAIYPGDKHSGDSCLRAETKPAKVSAELFGPGTLTFWWRAKASVKVAGGAQMIVTAGNTTTNCVKLKGESEWAEMRIEGVEIAAGAQKISFEVSLPGEYCQIADVTWTPALLPEVTVTNAVPVAVSGLVYTGGALTGVKEGDGYSIVGNVATNAGDYVAAATPDGGTVWEGGSSAPTNIAWSIAKAAYDMDGVTFASVTNVADGARKSIFVSGALPSGVTVAYEGNGRSEPGMYTVTAKFTGDATNYESIPDKTATLTLLEPFTGKYTIRFKVPTGLVKPSDMDCETGKVYNLPALPSEYKWRRTDAGGRLYDGGVLVFDLIEAPVLELEAVKVP